AYLDAADDVAVPVDRRERGVDVDVPDVGGLPQVHQTVRTDVHPGPHAYVGGRNDVLRQSVQCLGARAAGVRDQVHPGGQTDVVRRHADGRHAVIDVRVQVDPAGAHAQLARRSLVR